LPTTLVTPTTRFETYKVSGKTLADIAKSIGRKGPVDPNDRKRVAFLTATELDCNPSKGKYKATRKPKIDKTTGWFDAEVKIDNLKVTMISTITCPKRSVSGLSTMALVEWVRFYAACIVHEGKHVEKAKKECQKIVKEMNALRGTGLGETEADAETEAKNGLIFALHNFFDEQPDRLKEIHAKFDKSTRHGATKGALLDTSVI
jgi:predicted secreted Zn-dependent protease